VNETFLAIINPAAGGGRCGEHVGAALDRLRATGIRIETAETRRAGEATHIARGAYQRGFRRFLAVGGDGTTYEIVNGIIPESRPQRVSGGSGDHIPTLGFLPLGTGNSFLRDFIEGPQGESLEHSIRALESRRSRACDVLRLTHKDGEIYFTNLLSVRCLFLTFNNSKFTGGTMMIAPDAVTDDGLIEYVRWGPIGRLGLIRNLATLYDGTHTRHPLAERQAVRRVEFQLDGPVDVMVDGEVLTLECRTIEVLPAALRVVV